MSSDPGLTLAPPDLDLETARQLLRAGRPVEAEQAFRRVLATQPEHVEALRFLAGAALRRGAAGDAVDLLNRAANVDRTDIGTLMELGVAYRVADRMDASRYVLERALELSEGRNTAVRLLLANVLELDQRPELALPHYFRAILDAQHAGNWFSDETTEPGLRPFVRHAMQQVAAGRRDLFEGVLQPWRQSADTPLTRIDRALAIYLRDCSEAPADPRQRAGLLYVPGLGTSPRVDCGDLAWLSTLLARVDTAATEIESSLALSSSSGHAGDVTPGHSPDVGGRMNQDAAAQPRERQVDIYRCGTLHDSIRRRAPQLVAALADTPLLRVPRHAPDAAIVVLPAGVRTPIRHSCSNSRCSVVVSLPGSDGIDVIAGGETHRLQAGNGLVFDASYGIGYGNVGESEAHVLVFDIWHPGLAPFEQQALGALIAAIVDFDMRLQELA
jgi:aspartate beta-hydroxylase